MINTIEVIEVTKTETLEFNYKSYEYTVNGKTYKAKSKKFGSFLRGESLKNTINEYLS